MLLFTEASTSCSSQRFSLRHNNGDGCANSSCVYFSPNKCMLSPIHLCQSLFLSFFLVHMRSVNYNKAVVFFAPLSLYEDLRCNCNWISLREGTTIHMCMLSFLSLRMLLTLCFPALYAPRKCIPFYSPLNPPHSPPLFHPCPRFLLGPCFHIHLARSRQSLR